MKIPDLTVGCSFSTKVILLGSVYPSLSQSLHSKFSQACHLYSVFKRQYTCFVSFKKKKTFAPRDMSIVHIVIGTKIVIDIDKIPVHCALARGQSESLSDDLRAGIVVSFFITLFTFVDSYMYLHEVINISGQSLIKIGESQRYV